jgi:hypothetical protein
LIGSTWSVGEGQGDNLAVILVHDVARPPGSQLVNHQSSAIEKCRDTPQPDNVLARRGTNPRNCGILGARVARAREPLRPGEMIVEPIEKSTELVVVRSSQPMFPPKRERGLDYAAAMAVRWMAASRYKPYEIAIHDFVETS